MDSNGRQKWRNFYSLSTDWEEVSSLKDFAIVSNLNTERANYIDIDRLLFEWLSQWPSREKINSGKCVRYTGPGSFRVYAWPSIKTLDAV